MLQQIKKNESDPQVPHVFSARDMPVALASMQLKKSDVEDAEYGLLVCEAASHTHKIELHDVGGFPGRDLTLRFPAFEGCCQHPMLSEISVAETLQRMRDRCRSDTIMTVSFVSNVTPSGRFIQTSDGIRIIGTNLEEDRILLVTSKKGRVRSSCDFSGDEYEGVLHRMILNSYENKRRRKSGFSYTRCANVSRSAVLALFKIGDAVIEAVQNLVTAIKSGVPDQEIVWKQNGITICVHDLKCLDGYDHLKDCERSLDPLIEVLLSAANREVVGARSGIPPRVNLAAEEHCIERRLKDYFKAIILNNPYEASKYALMSATLEALVEVGGIESTLFSLCTSSLAKQVSNNKQLYTAMQLESVLGLQCQELESLSLPLTGDGNEQRTRRTRIQVRGACDLVANTRRQRVVKEEELLHDPEVLTKQYITGNLELDLLRISDHLIQCSKLVGHDTEIRMLNLLAISGSMISEQLEREEKKVCFYGITATKNSDGDLIVESDSGIRLARFVNLKALTNHSAVFDAMFSFLLGGPAEGMIEVENPVRCVSERAMFVRDVLRRFQTKGLSQARAIETAVMAVKVLSIRRAEGFAEKVIVDATVMEALQMVRGCVSENSTGFDLVDLVHSGNEDAVDHYGVDSRLLRPVTGANLGGRKFKLLDYMQNSHLYGKLDVQEDAVAFSASGQKYFAYCQKGRVHVRKRGLREEPRRRLGGNKIGLTLFGTGLVIELKEKLPRFSDNEAMGLIMSKAKQGSNTGLWLWSKIMSGAIKYIPTDDSCMWNKYAVRADAEVLGRWSVPKWVLQYMLVMVKDS